MLQEYPLLVFGPRNVRVKDFDLDISAVGDGTEEV
jgi:hypothetical protein